MGRHRARNRGDRGKNLVGFIVDGVHYAVHILRVREIINPLPVVSLPNAPPAVVGVADHRGAVVPIMDLRIRFGRSVAAVTRRTKWVVVDVNGRAVGLVVDAVVDVFGASQPDARDVQDLAMGESARGISAVYKHEGRLVFVLDVRRVAEPAAALDVGRLESLPMVAEP